MKSQPLIPATAWIPNITVAMVRAQPSPALLYREIHHHKTAPGADWMIPYRPKIPEPSMLIKLGMTSIPASTTMSAAAIRIDLGRCGAKLRLR